MLREFSNDTLKIVVDEHGAQLKSLVKDGHDFIWDGSDFWKYSSPILFPIVGKLKDDVFRFDGQNYTLPSHGFGRLSEFTFTDGEFHLNFSADTLKNYPFKFALHVGYALAANQLTVTNRVQNFDDKTIYFSIGAHPALRVDGDFDAWQLEFNQSEHAARMPLKDGLLSRERISTLDGRTLKLSYDLFEGDALIFDDLKSDAVTLRGKNRAVTLKAQGWPFWGFWTKIGAPFVCIEPWHGHADFADFNGELPDKDGIRALAVGEEFTTSYVLVVD